MPTLHLKPSFQESRSPDLPTPGLSSPVPPPLCSELLCQGQQGSEVWPHPTCILSPISFGILSKGLRLLTLLPTADIIYLPNVLAGKPNFYISSQPKFWGQLTNFPHDLIGVTLRFCSEWKPHLCSARLPAQYWFLHHFPLHTLVSHCHLPWQPLTVGWPPLSHCEPSLLHPIPSDDSLNTLCLHWS